MCVRVNVLFCFYVKCLPVFLRSVRTHTYTSNTYVDMSNRIPCSISIWMMFICCCHRCLCLCNVTSALLAQFSLFSVLQRLSKINVQKHMHISDLILLVWCCIQQWLKHMLNRIEPCCRINFQFRLALMLSGSCVFEFDEWNGYNERRREGGRTNIHKIKVLENFCTNIFYVYVSSNLATCPMRMQKFFLWMSSYIREHSVTFTLFQ